MASVTVVDRGVQGGALTDQAPPAGSTGRRVRPVIVWATVGAACAVMQLYVQGSWIISGDAHHIGTGSTPVPGGMRAVAVLQQVLLVIAMPTVWWLAVIRPWRHHRRIQFDGLFCLAFFLVWWQDPMFDYVENGLNYNSAYVNLGGWASHIPGWNPPNGSHIPEPLLWDLGFFTALACMGAIVVSNLMRRAAGRWPQMSTARLLIGTFVLWALLDVVAEMFWTTSGTYVYGSTIHDLTIFPSRYYRFPLYEPLGVGLLGLGWSSLRYFRDDRGQSLAERGIDDVHVGGRARTCLRFLAIVGVVNVVMLATYSLGLQIFQLHAGPWPASIESRSYFTNGLCGPGTSYACTGSDAGGTESQLDPGAIRRP